MNRELALAVSQVGVIGKLRVVGQTACFSDLSTMCWLGSFGNTEYLCSILHYV